MKHTVRHRTLVSLGGILALSLTLVGCGIIGTALPEEERYKRVNGILSQIDYHSAGKVVEEGYDTNSGLLSPSFFQVALKGDDSYKKLEEQIVAIPGAECQKTVTDASRLKCSVGLATIYLSSKKTSAGEDEVTNLLILDQFSGRDNE